jgi:DNA-binding NarL/FixJ family response regulator
MQYLADLPSDQRLSGIRFLQEAQRQAPSLMTIVVTQYQTEPLARVCLELGAKYVYRKWNNLSAIIHNISALRERQMEIQAIVERLEEGRET